jgi:fibronectin type 3 domain-containing protein
MEVISPSLADTSFIDTTSNLSRQTAYVYAVTAVSNASKESPFSEKISSRLPAGKERPQTPGGIRVMRRGGRLFIEWEDVKRNDPGILGYILYKHRAGHQPLAYDATKPASQEAARLLLSPVIHGIVRVPYFEDSLPGQGQRTEYLVSAVDAFGVESGLSPVGSSPLISPVSLRPPAQLFARAVKEGVSLQWEQADPAGVDGFVIYRRAVSEKNAKSIARVKNNVNQFTDRQTTSGTLYVYTVTALGESGETSPSDERTVRK